MKASLRARPGLLLFILAVLIGSFAAVRGEITAEMITPMMIAVVIAIILGEQLPMRIARRVIAPLTTAPALGLILAPTAAGEDVPSASTVLAVVWLSILVGGLLARLRGRSVVEGSLGSRFLGMAVVTLMARGIVVDGLTLHDWAFHEDTRPALGALGLLAAAAVGGVVERVLDSLVAWLGEGRYLSRILAEELGPLAGISAATVTTGPLIAVASTAIGWAAVPLLILPVLLSHLAVNRVVAIRQSLDESLRAMSRLSEVTGLTRTGHVQRVADAAVAIGGAMDLDAATLRDVERTALLHDVGQLGLSEPLRHGKTIHAGTREQVEMTRAVTQLIGDVPQLSPLVPLVSHVGTPFRRSREFGEHIPLPSRIVRVANALDDITEGARSARARAVALERLHLGLGYDYDPEVVAALERTFQQ